MEHGKHAIDALSRLPHDVVDHVFIGGVMVNMFASSVIDHVFSGGVMTNMSPMNT
jgi:3-phosphoglycerate kinase